MTQSSNDLITQCFKDYHKTACRYVEYRTGDAMTAEDLVQDAYVRLMEYKDMLQPSTLKSFFFTTVRNILIDYLRRYYKRQELDAYLMEYLPKTSTHSESSVVAKDIEKYEMKVVEQLPTQRRIVYAMSRFECKSVSEISLELCISERTVENHLRIGRQEVREEIRKACI